MSKSHKTKTTVVAYNNRQCRTVEPSKGGCVDDRKFEKRLQQMFKLDLSAGTEAFRDDLLARCLAVLGSDSASNDASEGIELDDDALDLLAAAGDPSALHGDRPTLD